MIESMKKIIYILTAFLFALTACNKEMDWNEVPTQDQPDAVYPEGASIDLIFGVPTTPRTKGEMNDLPDIRNDKMTVAVFDGSGSLKQYQIAEYVPVTENGSAGKDYFKVNLLLRSSEARLHFIVNGPDKATVTGGMETALMQQWVTDYPNAAYWQRIVLPDGITAYSFSAYKSGTTPWAENDKIDFYYRVRVVDGVTVYEHISKAVYDANHNTDSSYKLAQYTISISSGGTPQYLDGTSDDENHVSQWVNVGDFVDARGYKILDGTGYFQSATITDAVASVPLVRNFARLKIRAGSGGNFTPTTYYLMNVPNQGTIAPFSASVGGFAPEYAVSRYEREDEGSPYELVSGDPLVYIKTEGDTEDHDGFLQSLTKSKYPADIPSTAAFVQTKAEVVANGNQIPTSWKSYTVGAANAALENIQSAFLFERGLPNKNQEPTYLLIGGDFTDESGTRTRWFKVELTDGVGRYFRIFRDLTYFLEIGQITGSDGYGSAAAAALGEAMGDVSNSLATTNLEEVSDGKGTSIRVEYIDYVRGPEDPAEKTILYKVFNSATGDALEPMLNGKSRYTLEVTSNTGAIDEGYEIVDGAYSGVGPDEKSDWRIATVKLNDPSSSGILKGELTISGITTAGESSEKTLSRKVHYSVMGTQRLTLSATALPSEHSGENTKLTITLPTGLGYSLFPLILKIEAEKANMNPNHRENGNIDLPVDTGTSYFSGKNSFGFLFTINYSDYYDEDNLDDPYNTEFELNFKTTKDYYVESPADAVGSNETYISVTDQGGHFFYKPDDLSKLYDPTVNYAITRVGVTNGNRYFVVSSPSSQTVSAAAGSVTFSIQTNGDQAWTVGGTGAAVSPSSGKGNGVVTMSYTENEGSPRNLTATVTPTGGTAQTVTVVQRAEPKVSTLSITGLPTANQGSISASTLGNGTIQFTNTTHANGGGNITLGYRANRTNYPAVITVTPQNGARVTKIVITYSNAANAGYSDDDDDAVNTGKYTVSGSTGTWEGESTGAVRLTIGHNGNNNWPVATGIEVTYD